MTTLKATVKKMEKGKKDKLIGFVDDSSRASIILGMRDLGIEVDWSQRELFFCGEDAYVCEMSEDGNRAILDYDYVISEFDKNG